MNLPDPDALPPPTLRAPSRLPSLVWLVPLVALVIGIVLLIQAWQSKGPEILIRFDSAEGLEAGKTVVRYKNVEIGRVKAIRLSEDLQTVEVTVSLTRDGAAAAVQDSQFWVVRPRADLGGVSGLSTLVSGAYIGVDIGTSRRTAREFVGLEVPPRVTRDQRGRRFLLKAPALGSLSIGSPVYHRDVLVGRIVGYDLDEDGDGVTLQAFVEAPYDKAVTQRSRFWNVSGVDVSLDANGLSLSMQSLVSLVAGGVAFQDLPNGAEPQPAEEGTAFPLYPDRARALAADEVEVVKVRMRFNQSMRGLSVGAPVDFRGVNLGRVLATELEYDRDGRQFVAVVDAALYPRRLGRAFTQWRDRIEDEGARDAERLIAEMVEQGLAAQLRTGNLITGQLYVALELLPRRRGSRVDLMERPLVIPTVAGSFDQLQAQVAGIINKIDALPVNDLLHELRGAVTDLRRTITSANTLLGQLDGELTPEVRRVLEQAQQTLEAINQGVAAPDAPLQQDLRLMLEQVDRAARSLRNLTDTLQRNPQSLLRGRPAARVEDSE